MSASVSLALTLLSAAVLQSGPSHTIKAVCPDGTELMDFTSVDIDRDRRPDLAVVCGPDGPGTLGGTVALWRSREDGSFEPAGTLEPGDNPDEAAAGDLDGDGDDDLVVIAQGQHERTIAIFERTGETGFAAEPVTHSRGNLQTGGLVLHDADGDRKMDIILTRVTAPDNTALLLQEGAESIGPFREASLDGGGPDAEPYVIETSGDSFPDLVLEQPDGSLVLLAGNSDDRLELTLAGDNQLDTILGGGVINGDPIPDLVVRTRSDPSTTRGRLAFSDDTRLTLGEPLPDLVNPVRALVGNIDADPSRSEIITATWQSVRSDAPQAEVFAPDGEGFTKIGAIALGGYPYGLMLVDFDGDQRASLVIGSMPDNEIRVLDWPQARISDQAGPEPSASAANFHDSATTGEIPSCGTDQACFEAAFADCTPATATISASPTIRYHFEILEADEGTCRVRSQFLANPNPDFVGEAMVCAFNNAQPFGDAVRSIEACEGPLAERLTR
ncbi:FG-GAP-like repeat-containing protein [Marinicauda pacifica]|jgi:hypothetical protein|uniref:FG-GAP-like repeat-containing protein n=1 Tax=Marinicauda pacifica TaxID=1133559 RepID=UPI0035C7E3FA